MQCMCVWVGSGGGEWSLCGSWVSESRLVLQVCCRVRRWWWWWWWWEWGGVGIVGCCGWLGISSSSSCVCFYSCINCCIFFHSFFILFVPTCRLVAGRHQRKRISNPKTLSYAYCFMAFSQKQHCVV